MKKKIDSRKFLNKISGAGIVWDGAALDKWLTDPKKMVPGKFRILNEKEVKKYQTRKHFVEKIDEKFSTQKLMKYLGTKMVFAGLKKKADRKNLIAFLEKNCVE